MANYKVVDAVTMVPDGNCYATVGQKFFVVCSFTEADSGVAGTNAYVATLSITDQSGVSFSTTDTPTDPASASTEYHHYYIPSAPGTYILQCYVSNTITPDVGDPSLAESFSNSIRIHALPMAEVHAEVSDTYSAALAGRQ